MSGINKQQIDDYFREQFSSGGEKYLSNAFLEESNLEELQGIFKEQWDNISLENSDSDHLDHILYKINYQINSSEEKRVKPKALRFFNWYARIAALLLIPLLVYTGIVTNRQYPKSVGAEGWAEMRAPMGARIKFNLPDGSYGWLNSGSTITYSLNFNQRREVSLVGQAFFVVKHQDDNQFVVKTNYLDVEVKGTCFDVAAYDDEKQIDVTLERGVIVLKSDHFCSPVEMKPDEQISFNIEKQSITKSNVNAQYFSAWKEGKLMLRNASLEELAKQLSRWYNIDVRIQNSRQADFQYRATFEDENLNEVLRLLKISTPLDFKIEERVKQADGSFSKQKVLLIVKQSNSQPFKL